MTTKITISNEELYTRVKNGATKASLCREFGVSRMRIYQICNRQRGLEEAEKDELRCLCNRLAPSKNMVSMIYKKLRQGSKIYNIPAITKVEDLKYLPMNSIRKVDGLGVKSIAVIEAMVQYVEKENK